MGMAIVGTGVRIEKTPDADRPEHVVFMVLTDGEENASEEYRREQIAEMVKHQREKYQWDFVFLGANQDAVLTGVAGAVASAGGYVKSARAGARGAFTEADRKRSRL
jgi:Mg-chelatase subunit ChlD